MGGDRNFMRRVSKELFQTGDDSMSRRFCHVRRFHFAVKTDRLCSSEVVLVLRYDQAGRSVELNIIPVVLRWVSDGHSCERPLHYILKW